MSYVAWGGGLLVGGLVGYGVARGLWRWYRPKQRKHRRARSVSSLEFPQVLQALTLLARRCDRIFL